MSDCPFPVFYYFVLEPVSYLFVLLNLLVVALKLVVFLFLVYLLASPILVVLFGGVHIEPFLFVHFVLISPFVPSFVLFLSLDSFFLD